MFVTSLVMAWLVWLDYPYGMVGLGWVCHNYDLIPESLCKILHYLIICSEFSQLRAGKYRLGWITGVVSDLAQTWNTYYIKALGRVVSENV